MAAALGLWLWVTVPLALGDRTFYLRDVFSSHLAAKAFGAAELREGRVPAFNPTWGLGQPFRGNPNSVPLYPGNLLYLVLPFWSAFNLHYALHWLLAALAMIILARELGLQPPAALLAGLTYAGSGWVLTCLSFYNILAVSAWWPLVMWGAARGGRRGIALGGVACGLALLGGDPVTAAIGLAPLALVAWTRQGWRRGLLACLAIGGIGLLIALPQVVATARVIGFTFRGGYGDLDMVLPFHLKPIRFIELLIPFPFGLPWRIGPSGFYAWDGRPGLPYILTLHFGVVALWLSAFGLRKGWRWGLLGGAGLLIGWLGGYGGDLLLKATAGLMRHPEKFIFWFALSAALLAGWGLERVLSSSRAWRGAALAALAVLLLAATLFIAGPLVAKGLAGHVWPTQVAPAIQFRMGYLIVALLTGAVLLGLAAWAARRRSAWGLTAVQLLALLPLAGIATTAPVEGFAPGPWERFLPQRPAAVASESVMAMSRTLQNRYEIFPPTHQALIQMVAFDLGPSPGVLHGFTSPLARDLDGMQSPLTVMLLRNLPLLDWPQRLQWMRVMGVDAVVLEQDPDIPGLTKVSEMKRFGGMGRLFKIRNPAPPVWWPRSVTTAASPSEALEIVRHAADPVADVVSAWPVKHQPGGQARLLKDDPDHLQIDVSGPGGLLVVRRVYQPLYRATIGGKELRTVPVNLTLLGIEVPPGNHRVRIDVSATPEIAAGVVALVVFLGALVLPFTPLLPGEGPGVRSREHARPVNESLEGAMPPPRPHPPTPSPEGRGGEQREQEEAPG